MIYKKCFKIINYYVMDKTCKLYKINLNRFNSQ